MVALERKITGGTMKRGLKYRNNPERGSADVLTETARLKEFHKVDDSSRRRRGTKRPRCDGRVFRETAGQTSYLAEC